MITAFNFLQLLGGIYVWSILLLVALTFPDKSGAIATDGQKRVLALAPCTAVAIPLRGTREGDQSFVHVGACYAEKKSAASVPAARVSTPGMNESFAAEGSAACVCATGAVRGDRAGPYSSASIRAIRGESHVS